MIEDKELSVRLAEVAKWVWMMEYCKEHRNPPGQSWAWKEAEKAWEAALGVEIGEKYDLLYK